jgi:serine/threonine protein kinase
LREAQRLIELPEITGELYLGHGEIGSITWLLRRWIDGVTATDHTSTIRSQPLSLAAKWQFVDDLCQMLKKVIRLDDLGYLHGDLQPRHFIIDAQGTFRLIDLEMAVRKDEFEPLYPGALIHFVSPETAREMLVDNQHIPLDPLSEIYSFAAVAFTLYTGQPPTMCGEAKEERVSFEQRLQAIVQGRNKSFAQAGATPFPELEQILLRCLAPERGQRYQTFTALLSAFQSIF